MERSGNKLISLIFIVGFCYTLQGSFKTDIYTAYINGNMQSWKQIMDEMDKNRSTQPGYILELVNYQYGYIAWCIGNERDDEAEKYLDLAEKNVEWLEKIKHNLSMINAYKAAFYGYRIGLNSLKALYYGPKSIHCAEEAIALNKNNPYGYIQYANAQYYMPAVFGGSKQTAIDYFAKAEKLMEQNKEQILNDWNYLNLLTTIANSFIDTRQPEKAKIYFDKILKVEPNYQWVKYNLYPQFLKDLK
jgi:tetratricopeptide (TPR) repeat protein